MQLVLERCTVRPWRLDDAESLARHANNRKIWLTVRDLFPHPYTIQDAHEFLHRAMTEQPEMRFCVEIEGAAVGGIGVHPGQDVHRFAATMGHDAASPDLLTQPVTNCRRKSMHVLAGVYTDPADGRALNLNAKFHFRLFGHRSLQEFVRVLDRIRMREKIAYRQPDFAIVGVSGQRLSIVQSPRTNGTLL